MLFLTATGTIVLAWLWMTCMFNGVGLLARRVFRLPRPADPDGADFWIGLVTSLLLLQILHLFVPIGRPVFYGFAVTGTLAFLILGRGQIFQRTLLFPSSGFDAFIRVGTLALCVLTAYKSLGPLWNYDSGLYHLTGVRWIQHYSIVPGLANLHSRLGFNNSNFILGALLNGGPWPCDAYHLTNGLLVVNLFAVAGRQFRALYVDPAPLPDRLFGMLLVLPLIILAVCYDLPSYSTDLSSALPAFVIFWQLLKLARTPHDQASAQREAAFLIAAVGALGITFKLSNALFVLLCGGAAALLILAGNARRPRRALALLAPGLAAALLLLLPWLVRGVILSGYPLYPSTFAGLAFDWTLAPEECARELTIVKNWARAPGIAYWNVPSGWAWIPDWLQQQLKQSYFFPWDIKFPLTLALGSLVLSAASGLLRRRAPARELALVLIPAAAVALWFVSAPDPRFIFGPLWILALAPLASLLQKSRPTASLPGQSLAIAVAFSLAIFALISNLYWSRDSAPTALDPEFGYHPIPTVSPKTFVTDSGLELQMRVDSPPNERIYDLPLPATPYPRKDLILRHPGSLQGGFRIQPAVK
jgi:hypothetical protein